MLYAWNWHSSVGQLHFNLKKICYLGSFKISGEGGRPWNMTEPLTITNIIDIYLKTFINSYLNKLYEEFKNQKSWSASHNFKKC